MLKIIYLKEIDSTQKYLISALKKQQIQPPIAIFAKHQTNAQGSRTNSWISKEGNLHLSFALKIASLPKDLKLESSSIYFAYLLKLALESFDSKIWIKWPNDLYIDDKKVGGVITTVVKDNIVCGVGLNVKSAPKEFAILDIALDIDQIISTYFINLEKKFSWKYIFSKYRLEFYKSKKYFSHNHNQTLSLGDASLLNDGSILCKGQRIFSLR